MASRQLPLDSRSISLDGISDVLHIVDEDKQQENVPLLLEKYEEWEASEPNPEILLNEGVENIETTSQHIKCGYCSKEKRVESVSELQPGQHITMSGRLSSKHIKYLKKQFKLYKHHAIVKEVVAMSEHKVELKLIHFTQGKGRLQVMESTEIYDLKYDELYIVQYKQSAHTADEIIRRAESAGGVNFKTYHIFSCNCEHFATWCVVGEGESYQVESYIRKLVNMISTLFGEGSKVGRFILRILLNTTDEIATGVSSTSWVPTAVLGATAVTYLLYCIVETMRLVQKYTRGNGICKACFKAKLYDMWFRFGVFGLSSIATYAFVHFIMPLISCGVGVAVLIVMILLSVALQWSIPSIRKIVQSPFQYGERRVVSFSEIDAGDIIVYKYYGFEHEAVVSDIPKRKSSTEGDIRVIHYAWPSIFSYREIVEETITVNLKNHRVIFQEYDHQNAFPRQEVVARARKRVGEKKWHGTSNRSAHFCWWAKVKREFSVDVTCPPAKDIGKTKSTQLSTALVGEYDVHLIEEIGIGDVVKYGGSKIGIVIELRNEHDGRKFRMNVITKGESCSVREKVRVDLDTRSLVVRKYHPAHCYSMAERKERALAMEGKRCGGQIQLAFVENIVLLS